MKDTKKLKIWNHQSVLQGNLLTLFCCRTRFLSETSNVYKMLVAKPERKRPLHRQSYRWKDNNNPLSARLYRWVMLTIIAF